MTARPLRRTRRPPLDQIDDPAIDNDRLPEGIAVGGEPQRRHAKPRVHEHPVADRDAEGQHLLEREIVVEQTINRRVEFDGQF